METYIDHDKREKHHRNHLLRQFASDHPDMSYRELGNIFRITKQRVGIIINNGGQNESRKSQGNHLPEHQ